MIYPTCRESTIARGQIMEHHVEYRGVVASDRPLKEIDVCPHRHRTREAALRCAQRMCIQAELMFGDKE